ncbi:signal recognition particle 9 kDa protein-domain-containing protein [Xylaria sp. FL1777]|nr:signal recognition particle 9 kDa protein-domain-containing protein [Xylaria sp. FL1777]
MPYYETSQEWLRQSALLLEARPSTTRITTNYHLTDKTGSSKRRQKRRQQQREQSSAAAAAASTTTATATAAAAAPRASLTIKTYDPHSGACLKYRTTKAAEVSRLILSLGQLGRKMAALPAAAAAADIVMADVGGAEEVVGTSGVEKEKAEAGSSSAGGSSGAKSQAQAQTQIQTQGQGQSPAAGSGSGSGSGGKGKKKRGKK